MGASSLPAGPRGHLLVGSLLDLTRDPLAFFPSTREYGDCVPVHLGPTHAFVLNRPDLIETALVTQRQFFRKGDGGKHVQPLFGDGLLTCEGEEWSHQRHLADPSVDLSRIAPHLERLTAFVSERVAGWQDGEAHDFFVEALDIALEATLIIFFGDRADDLELRAAFEAGQHAFLIPLTTLLLSPPGVVPTRENRQLHRTVAALDQVVHAEIARRREEGTDTGDVLSSLILSRDDDGQRLSDSEIRDVLLTMALSAESTIPLLVTWAWYLLAQNPEIEQRLAAELSGTQSGAVSQLPLMQKVIMETLRLYPPSWILDRMALADRDLGGHAIKKGSTVFMCQWSLHRDGRWFEQADAFLPDRWTDDFRRQLPAGAYFPFGLGPRSCIGRQVAPLVGAVVLAKLDELVQPVSLPGFEPVLEAGVTLHPGKGVWMIVRKRTDSLTPSAVSEPSDAKVVT